MKRFKMMLRDIKWAVPRNSCSCPIARCIRRSLKTRLWVRVHDDSVTIGPKQYRTSRAMARFIRAFDTGQKVKPIGFTLQDAN